MLQEHATKQTHLNYTWIGSKYFVHSDTDAAAGAAAADAAASAGTFNLYTTTHMVVTTVAATAAPTTAVFVSERGKDFNSIKCQLNSLFLF